MGHLSLICCSKAPGVREFFDALLVHWETILKDLHAQRLRRKSEGRAEVIEIPDDDCKGVSMEELEKKSLQKAREGIIMVDSDEVLEDDGYADPQETDNGEVPEAMSKEKHMAEEKEKPTIEEKPMPKEALEEPKSADDHGGTRSVDDAMKAMAEQRRKELIQQLVFCFGNRSSKFV